MKSLRILPAFLLSLLLVSGVAQAATVNVSACTSDALKKILIQKIAEGDAENLRSKRWWNRCPVESRKSAWESFLMKPDNDGSAAWQLPTSSPLPVLRNAPELSDTGGSWFGGEPLTMSKLRGKVVLVHFWTFGCVNCIRTLSKIEGLYEKYEAEGLTVIGVHSPEFAYERSIQNVQSAIRKYGLTYPVMQDNDFSTWNAYGNQYWPALYLIDREGRIRYAHFGEGAYKETEDAVRSVLAESR